MAKVRKVAKGSVAKGKHVQRHVAKPAPRANAPSSADWAQAFVTIKMVDDFDDDDFRGTVARLARVLECEGLAAHRSADRLENRSEFRGPVSPSEHTREAILAKVSNCYTDHPWHVATAYLTRLRDAGLHDPGQLRQQAAILLDAAETIDRLLRWYAARLASAGTRDLTNDTIVAIMREWNVGARETSRQLAVHGLAVTEGALKMVLARQRELAEVGNEPSLLFYVPLLRRGNGNKTK